MSDLPEYVLDRTFAAPRELVWRAWTEPELLNRWYGPGAETVIHEFDLNFQAEIAPHLRHPQLRDVRRLPRRRRGEDALAELGRRVVTGLF